MKRFIWPGWITAGLVALAIWGVRVWQNNQNAKNDDVMNKIMDNRKRPSNQQDP